MTKQFTILKVGYTVGIYGCSGEYFNAIIVKGKKISNIKFKGMYGAEERVANALKEKGYVEHWISSDFGKMITKDVRGRFLSEYQALDLIKTNQF